MNAKTLAIGRRDPVHGTRARYVRGCRCSRCRAANCRAYHDRQRRAKAAALAFAAASTTTGVPQRWTARDGSTQLRVYRRACPGTTPSGCPFRSHLRTDSIGGICARCRSRLVWNGLVAADRARQHLITLSRAGVGRRAVAAASNVSHTSLQRIRRGRKMQIRADTERRILAVDVSCVSDAALIDARPTWKRIRRLLAEGYPAVRLARLLGLRGQGLQFGRRRITARNALRVERLYRELLALS